MGINAGWEERGYGLMLDGDVLADRSFRTWGTPRDVWQPVVTTGGSATYVAASGATPAGAQSYDGYVHLAAAAGEQTVLAQRVIGTLRSGTTYRLTFSSRATVQTPVLSAVVVQVSPFAAVSNTAFAASAAGPAWAEHQLDLTVTQDVLDAVVYVAVAGPGEADIDEVRFMRVSSGPPQVDPVLKQWLVDLGVTSLRWPGGFAADLLVWRDMVGPLWERGEHQTSLHAPETPAFGLNEVLALTEELGLELLLQLSALAPAQEAADLVEYLRGDASSTPGGVLRAMHGHPLPYNVSVAEIGNEPAEAYSPLADPSGGDVYAQNAQAIITAVAAVDPTLRLSAVTEATFQTATWVAAAPLLAEWNARAMGGTFGLRNQAHLAHGHYYSVFGLPPSPQDVFSFLMAGGQVWRDAIASVRVHTGSLPYRLTEYHVTVLDSSNLVNPDRLKDLQAALGVADIMLAAMDTQLEGASFFNLSERVGFGALTDPLAWRPRPSGLAFQMLSTLGGEARMTANISPVPATVSVAALGNIGSNVSYPVVTALATQQPSGQPRVVMINRNAAQGYTVEIQATESTWTAADITVLQNADLAATNETSVNVTLQTSTLQPGEVLTLPPASLVRADLR